MKYNIIFGIFCLGLLWSCDNASSDLELDVPTCIENKITTIIKENRTNPPTQVWKWQDSENVYYYITSDCCDQYNYLYDENCNQVCAPDGGFTGNGDGNCPDFTDEIVKILIWEDER